jgi:putative ABC transport system substrate-binding protein
VNRRDILLAIVAMGAARPPALFAQQPVKIARIGFLHSGSMQGADRQLQAFRDGLRALGYVEGKNVQVEIRWGDGNLEVLPTLANELVEKKVDLIVAVSSPAVVAARRATRTIPIVMPLSSDPVGDGLVASLAHPGGNITGLSVMAPELGEKRLQLLKELFPKVSRVVAAVWSPAYVGMRTRYEQAKVAGPEVGLTIQSMGVRDPRELDLAFEAIKRERPDALLLLVDARHLLAYRVLGTPALDRRDAALRRHRRAVSASECEWRRPEPGAQGRQPHDKAPRSLTSPFAAGSRR